MNKSLLASVLATALFSVGLVSAQPVGTADKGAQKEQQQAPDVVEFDKRMAQALENMKKMQIQMDNLQRNQDPKERQKLLREHWGTMQSSMSMMRDMWGSGMMGCCAGGHMRGGHMIMGDEVMGSHMMGWRDTQDYYLNLTPEQVKQRQYMMDQFTGMQQIMMDQMMQHQNYMWMQPTP